MIAVLRRLFEERAFVIVHSSHINVPSVSCFRFIEVVFSIFANGLFDPEARCACCGRPCLPYGKRRLAIHDEQVLVMFEIKFQACRPASVRHPFHGSGSEVPPVEVADKPHTFGTRRIAKEGHLMPRAVCGAMTRRDRWAGFADCGIHAGSPFQGEASPGLVSQWRFSRLKIASLLVVPTILARTSPLTKQSKVGMD